MGKQRGHDDAPSFRPYRWADTPLDPFGSDAPTARRRRSWIVWTVVIAVVLGALGVGALNAGDVAVEAPDMADGPRPTVPEPVVEPVGEPPPDLLIEDAAAPQPGHASPGEPVTVDAITVTVHGWEVTSRSGIYGPEGLVTVEVSVVNNGGERASYSAFDWELQHPDGRIEGARPSLRPDELSLSGGLAPGGQVSGSVSFTVPPDPVGEHLVLYSDSRPFSPGETAAWSIQLP
jgi:hypothetical protein